MKEIKDLTDAELVAHAIAKSKLTPLEVELLLRIEDHLDWEYFVFPQWALDMMDPDEEIPELLN